MPVNSKAAFALLAILGLFVTVIVVGILYRVVDYWWVALGVGTPLTLGVALWAWLKVESGFGPLQSAEKELKAVVKKLLPETSGLLHDTVKIDVNAKDCYGRTLVFWAVERGQETVVDLVLAAGKVDVDGKDIAGQTVLSWAVANGHDAIIQKLVTKYNADVNTTDNDGRTPLSLAAANGKEAIVKQLLAANSDSMLAD